MIFSFCPNYWVTHAAMIRKWKKKWLRNEFGQLERGAPKRKCVLGLGAWGKNSLSILLSPTTISLSLPIAAHLKIQSILRWHRSAVNENIIYWKGLSGLRSQNIRVRYISLSPFNWAKTKTHFGANRYHTAHTQWLIVVAQIAQKAIGARVCAIPAIK